jgi:glycerol-3-phosphate dehydrogenase (NAD(P)+)
MKIAVLGGGSWGATVASRMAREGLEISLWEIQESQVEYMIKNRGLPFLKDLKLPDSMKISSDMEEVLTGAGMVISAVPSQFVRETWKKAKRYVGEVELVASLSKGIEAGTLKRMSEIILEEFPGAKGKIAVITGPSHAEEVARDVPTALIAASERKATAELAQKLLSSKSLRIYPNPDVVGAELCGAVKNVFAIACGACDGLGLGDNTKAAVMTRGLQELARLGKTLGANPVTFYGLAGMGDLIVTCMSQHSRNRLLGEKIGKGKKTEEALKEMTMVAEGYPNARSAYQLAQKNSCDCPVITEVYRALYEGKNIKECLNDLLSRPIPAGESKELSWKA